MIIVFLFVLLHYGNIFDKYAFQYLWPYRSCCHNDALPILPENGLSNRIRGLFESAIATEMGAHCPILWRMYIHFLVRRAHTNPLTCITLSYPGASTLVGKQVCHILSA